MNTDVEMNRDKGMTLIYALHLISRALHRIICCSDSIIMSLKRMQKTHDRLHLTYPKSMVCG